jgi:hypothetical protein
MSCRQHCYDDGDEEPDYEFDESGFNQNQHMAENIDDLWSQCKFFKQFDTIKNFSHHYYANKLV